MPGKLYRQKISCGLVDMFIDEASFFFSIFSGRNRANRTLIDHFMRNKRMPTELVWRTSLYSNLATAAVPIQGSFMSIMSIRPQLGIHEFWETTLRVKFLGRPL